MRNDRIGEGLKRYRKQNGMTVAEVAVEIKGRIHRNVAEKTIYGWESNQAHPTSDMLLVLCEIYHINDWREAFGVKNIRQRREFRISAEERALIEHYRAHPELREAVRRVLDIGGAKGE